MHYLLFSKKRNCSIWDWKDSRNEANFLEARSLASDSWTLDHVSFFHVMESTLFIGLQNNCISCLYMQFLFSVSMVYHKLLYLVDVLEQEALTRANKNGLELNYHFLA